MAGKSKYVQTTVLLKEGPALVEIVRGPRDADLRELYRQFHQECPGDETPWHFVDWLTRNHGFRVDDTIEVVYLD